MKHILSIITAILGVVVFFCSCSQDATYAEQVEKERNAINDWIQGHNIQVISSDQFEAQGNMTNDNQYVLFNSTGVYMHVVSKGTDGSPLAQGKSAKVISRFTETNVNTRTVILTNDNMYYLYYLDVFNVRNYYGTFTGSFESGAMYSYYGSTAIPNGWLVPLKYINLGRGGNKYVQDANGNYLDKNGNITTNPDEYVAGSNAHVQIIVPHDQGTSSATSSVYATYYDLTYELADK